jgi:tetratricopeptide (TPR) repeat protein
MGHSVDAVDLLLSSAPDTALGNALVGRALANLSQATRAKSFLATATQLLSREPETIPCLWIQAEGYEMLGQTGLADTLFQRAFDHIECMQPGERRSRELATLAGVLARAGRTERVDRCLRMLRSEKADRFDNTFVWAVQMVGHGLALAGQPDLAYEYARSLEQEFDRSHILTEVAGAYAKKGDYDRALAVADEAGSQRDWALFKIAVELAWVGRPGEAVQLALEMINASGVAPALVATGAIEHFKTLMLTSTRNPGTLVLMLNLLAAAYPASAATIEDMVRAAA